MPGRVPELTTRNDHPPQSWSRHGETRQLPQRDAESALGCDARTGPQRCTGDLEGCRHPNTATGPPSTEAAASTVDAPRGLLLVSNATMMHSALKDTAGELGVTAEWRLFYAAHSSQHATDKGDCLATGDRSWCVVTARTCSSSPVTMSGPLISKNAAARIDGFRAGNIAATI
jgi:hypothetical protein